MPGYRRSRRPRTTNRRSREWHSFALVDSGSGFPGGRINLTANNSVYAGFINSPDDMTILYDEPTLVRGIMDYDFIQPTGQSVSGFMLGLGLIKSSIEGFPGAITTAAVLATVPRPYLDGDSPWIWRRTITWGLATGFTGYTFNSAAGQQPEEFATKRKFHNGEGLLLVAEAFNYSAGAVNVNLGWSGRLLWLNG